MGWDTSLIASDGVVSARRTMAVASKKASPFLIPRIAAPNIAGNSSLFAPLFLAPWEAWGIGSASTAEWSKTGGESPRLSLTVRGSPRRQGPRMSTFGWRRRVKMGRSQPVRTLPDAGNRYACRCQQGWRCWSFRLTKSGHTVLAIRIPLVGFVSIRNG